MGRLYTMTEVHRELGTTNWKFLAALIRQHAVPTTRVGVAVCVDERGLATLRAKVREWRERPRPYSTRAVK